VERDQRDELRREIRHDQPAAAGRDGADGRVATPTLAAGTNVLLANRRDERGRLDHRLDLVLHHRGDGAASHSRSRDLRGDVPASNLHGAWTTASDATSPKGFKLATPDNAFASTDTPLAAPTHYVDITFTADANTTYALWFRMKALSNNKFNDSIWVQFSDALAGGSPVYPLNSTSALDVNLATDAGAASLNNWGWQNGAYWLMQSTKVKFASGGTHTMRIQIREDGVQLDQIVLSSVRYLNAAPGGPTNDTTIVSQP
jgi:hypothetical protein